MVPEAAPPQDRDKLEALQFRGSYSSNRFFFFFLPAKQLKVSTWRETFCCPGRRGGCFRGAFLTPRHRAALCSGCGWRECPRRVGPGCACGIPGAPLLKNWGTERDKCAYRGFCIEALLMHLEVLLECRLMSPCFPRSGAALQGGASAGGESQGVYLVKRERRRMSLIVFSWLSPEHLITFFFFFKDWTFLSLFL